MTSFVDNMKTDENKQLMTLFIIFIICLRYIYNENKDTYVYISLVFVYAFFCIVLHKSNIQIPFVKCVYVLIIPIILNIVGMTLAYKSSDDETRKSVVSGDIRVMKNLIVACFVFISIIVMFCNTNYNKILYFLIFILYILSICVVVYANRANTKYKRATG